MMASYEPRLDLAQLPWSDLVQRLQQRLDEWERSVDAEATAFAATPQ
jgi:hypothetical protein